MAKLRKFSGYRRLQRPYTRKSKFKEKSFIKASPSNKIVRYDMGDPNGKFDLTLNLKSREDLQIRHNAIESARLLVNKILEDSLGKTGYHLKIMVYPHHVLRENPLASGAGADRMSTGMKMSFGKAIGLAARIKKNQVVIRVRCKKDAFNKARSALQKAGHKFPCSYFIEVVNK